MQGIATEMGTTAGGRPGRLAGRGRMLALVLGLLMALCLPAYAQESTTDQSAAPPAPPPSPLGFTGFLQVQYGATSLGNVIITDADLGYQVTDHLSGDIGLPVIWTRNPFSPVTGHDYYWSTLLGEPYVDIKYSSNYKEYNYTSILTGTIPVGNEDSTFTTGRVGVDWFNHIDEHMGNITPFLNFGASNGTLNRFIMPRPYSEARPYETLGVMGDAEAGFEYKLKQQAARGASIGGSYYILVPGGPQKVFSRYVFPFSVLEGDGQHHRYFDSTFETNATVAVIGGLAYSPPPKGLSTIDRDNGFSVWLDIPHWHPVDVQLSYTRSVRYLLDMYTVTINFDGKNLIRSLMPHR